MKEKKGQKQPNLYKLKYINNSITYTSKLPFQKGM